MSEGEDQDDEELPPFSDFDLPTRLRIARERMAPIVELLGGELQIEDEEGEPADLEVPPEDPDACADEWRSLVLHARRSSGREVTVAARLWNESIGFCRGEVRLALALDSRMHTWLCLMRPFDRDEPDPGYMTPVAPRLFVCDPEEKTRKRMIQAMARLPALATQVERVMADFDMLQLDVDGTRLHLTFGWLDDDAADELAAEIRRLDDVLTRLEEIAALIETLPPESFVTCRYCGARVSAGLTGCSRCGASL